MPRRFLNFHPKRYLGGELILNISLLVLFLVFFWLTINYSIPQNFLVPFFLIGKIAFDLFVRSKVRRWSLNG